MNYIFNSGELSIQKKYGEGHIADRVQRVIKNTIVRGAIAFIEKLPMALVSSMDENENIWISILTGDYGFATVPDEQTVSFNMEKIWSSKADIFYQNIEKNTGMGILFIELGSRRRFRVNGKASLQANEIIVSVEESYPNCPKYIQQRLSSRPTKSEDIMPKELKGESLDSSHRDWVSKADTFFVGSKSKGGKFDASHRGGNLGFIEILEDGTLKIPDYVGNAMYNTLGNVMENPNVGLLFLDFEKGKILQLTGKSTLLFDQNSDLDNKRTTDTGRYWLFKTTQWIETENHHQLDWEYVDSSPFNPFI